MMWIKMESNDLLPVIELWCNERGLKLSVYMEHAPPTAIDVVNRLPVGMKAPQTPLYLS